MRLFAYAIDFSPTNAWVIYRCDCKALAMDGLSLRNFRIQVIRGVSSQRPILSWLRRSSASPGAVSAPLSDVSEPLRVHRSRSLCALWSVPVPCPCLQQPTNLQVLLQKGEHLEVKCGLQGLQGPPMPQCWMQLLHQIPQNSCQFNGLDWTSIHVQYWLLLPLFKYLL